MSREELRRELWTDDTFVSFDICLNVAVNKIRRAIGDSATSPRFIETHPRRGYRFVAPVAESNSTIGATSFLRRRRQRLAAALVTILAGGSHALECRPS